MTNEPATVNWWQQSTTRLNLSFIRFFSLILSNYSQLIALLSFNRIISAAGDRGSLYFLDFQAFSSSTIPVYL